MPKGPIRAGQEEKAARLGLRRSVHNDDRRLHDSADSRGIAHGRQTTMTNPDDVIKDLTEKVRYPKSYCVRRFLRWFGFRL
jgi:hypothetical protein